MKKRYTLWILCPLVLILGFASCIDVIDLKISENVEVLIIEGNVFHDGRFPEVYVRKSAAFSAGPTGIEQPVSGAEVWIEEIDGESYLLKEIEAGLYIADQALGTPGLEYRLTVKLNGEEYISGLEKMPNPIALNAVNWEVQSRLINNQNNQPIRQNVVTLLADADLPEGPGTYLRYRILGAYEYRETARFPNLNPKACYINEGVDFNNLVLVNSEEIQNGTLRNQPILSKLLDDRFAYNFCFSTVQQSISRDAWLFWRSVQNEFERSGDIFEIPPARIQGNILNTNGTQNVIGLFSAIATDTVKFTLDGLDLGPDRVRGECQTFGTLPENCFDCAQIINSSTIKPECFD